MNQMGVSDFDNAGKLKQTCRECFLAEVDQILPLAGLLLALHDFHIQSDQIVLDVVLPIFSKTQPAIMRPEAKFEKLYPHLKPDRRIVTAPFISDVSFKPELGGRDV